MNSHRMAGSTLAAALLKRRNGACSAFRRRSANGEDNSVVGPARMRESWHSELMQHQQQVATGVPFDLQLSHFCRVIRGEEEPSCGPEAGLAALIVCQAIKEAVEGNKTVEIEEYVR